MNREERKIEWGDGEAKEWERQSVVDTRVQVAVAEKKKKRFGAKINC